MLTALPLDALLNHLDYVDANKGLSFLPVLAVDVEITQYIFAYTVLCFQFTKIKICSPVVKNIRKERH